MHELMLDLRHGLYGAADEHEGSIVFRWPLQ
jgi:hypothetical protein